MFLLFAQVSGLEVQDASLCPETFTMEEDLQVCFTVSFTTNQLFFLCDIPTRLWNSPQTSGKDPGMAARRSLWRRSSHTNVISFSS